MACYIDNQAEVSSSDSETEEHEASSITTVDEEDLLGLNADNNNNNDHSRLNRLRRASDNNPRDLSALDYLVDRADLSSPSQSPPHFLDSTEEVASDTEPYPSDVNQNDNQYDLSDGFVVPDHYSESDRDLHDGDTRGVSNSSSSRNSSRGVGPKHHHHHRRRTRAPLVFSQSDTERTPSSSSAAAEAAATILATAAQGNLGRVGQHHHQPPTPRSIRPRNTKSRGNSRMSASERIMAHTRMTKSPSAAAVDLTSSTDSLDSLSARDTNPDNNNNNHSSSSTLRRTMQGVVSAVIAGDPNTAAMRLAQMLPSSRGSGNSSSSGSPQPQQQQVVQQRNTAQLSESDISRKRSRVWMFTVNNPTEQLTEGFNNPENGVKYAVWQLEKGRGNYQGTPHYQGFIRFHNAKSRLAVSRILPRAWVQAAYGTDERCEAYCTKEEGRLEGPWRVAPEPPVGGVGVDGAAAADYYSSNNNSLNNSSSNNNNGDNRYAASRSSNHYSSYYSLNADDSVGADGDHHQQDTDQQQEATNPARGQGKRSDLARIKEDLKKGMTAAELFDKYPGQYIRYGNRIEACRSLLVTPREEMPTVWVIYGKPNYGKTHLAGDLLEGKFYSKMPGKWWDFYGGEPNVLIDDFAGAFSFTEMKLLCDKYQYKGEVKGATVLVPARKVVITTNIWPTKWWDLTREKIDWEAFTRRVYKWVYFTAPRTYTIYNSWEEFAAKGPYPPTYKVLPPAWSNNHQGETFGNYEHGTLTHVVGDEHRYQQQQQQQRDQQYRYSVVEAQRDANGYLPGQTAENMVATDRNFVPHDNRPLHREAAATAATAAASPVVAWNPPVVDLSTGCAPDEPVVVGDNEESTNDSIVTEAAEFAANWNPPPPEAAVVTTGSADGNRKRKLSAAADSAAEQQQEEEEEMEVGEPEVTAPTSSDTGANSTEVAAVTASGGVNLNDNSAPMDSEGYNVNWGPTRKKLYLMKRRKLEAENAASALAKQQANKVVLLEDDQDDYCLIENGSSGSEEEQPSAD
jgi:hypothetical protein